MDLTNLESANSFSFTPEKENLNANLCSKDKSYFYPDIPFLLFFPNNGYRLGQTALQLYKKIRRCSQN